MVCHYAKIWCFPVDVWAVYKCGFHWNLWILKFTDSTDFLWFQVCKSTESTVNARISMKSADLQGFNGFHQTKIHQFQSSLVFPTKDELSQKKYSLDQPYSPAWQASIPTTILLFISFFCPYAKWQHAKLDRQNEWENLQLCSLIFTAKWNLLLLKASSWCL